MPPARPVLPAAAHRIPPRPSAAASSSKPPSLPMSSLESLPTEIFLEVASYLSAASDLLQLSQVPPPPPPRLARSPAQRSPLTQSRNVYAKMLPALYADVDLHGAEQCERTLAMIERSPDVARHVRKLTVHPEHESLSRPRDQYRAWDNAGVVSRCVMRAARNLDALHHFEWDGEDMLPDDRMWAELRTRCPRLKSIGTTFGCFLPRPTSSLTQLAQLFQFDDLREFSLTLKDGFYAHSLHVPSRGGSAALKDQQVLLTLADPASESEPVFARLWDMLTLRCPALEALSIVGHSSEPSEAARLYAAHWPSLKRLTLGALVWNTSVPGQPGAAPVQAHGVGNAPDFKSFLEKHPSIECLHLVGRPSSNQLDLSALAHDALPNLKEFSGSFAHLRMLVDRAPPPEDDPNGAPVQVQNANANANPAVPATGGTTALSKTLQRICFPHAMHLRDLTPVTISRVLQSLHALTSLKVTFVIQGGYDSNGILRTIAASCPHLLDLDLTCTTKPSFFLDAFATHLRGLPRLRTLALTLVRMPGEEPLPSGAARIALANPRLKTFSIAFLPPQATAAAVAAEPPMQPVERGAFELVCDAHGIPVWLRVALWSARGWGPFGFGGGGGGALSSLSSLPLSAPLARPADVFALPGVRPGAGVVEWFAAVAGAFGLELPLALLQNRAHHLGHVLPTIHPAPAPAPTPTAPPTPHAPHAAPASWSWFPHTLLSPAAAGGKRRVRRWTLDLRPSGHPDVAPKGVWALLVERGPAGEEARLMVFCLALLGLTVWALVGRAVVGTGVVWEV
ncbi:hypothetical protein ACG7TL_005053 [Trametes sanguinea]